jgi:hypothetical protein
VEAEATSVSDSGTFLKAQQNQQYQTHRGAIADVKQAAENFEKNGLVLALGKRESDVCAGVGSWVYVCLAGFEEGE